MSLTSAVKYSVFTKPWKSLSINGLAEFVKGVGFDGVEFPVRDHFQVTPDNAERDLPQLVRTFSDYGLSVFSVASSLDEKVFSACASAGVPIIRIMSEIGSEGYVASEKRTIEWLQEDIIPLCERYGITVAIQQHYGNYVNDSSGLRRIVENFNPTYVGAVWDAAHDALAGQQPEYGLDILWPHLSMVNFKNAHYIRTHESEVGNAEWGRVFTTGSQGMASWPRAVSYLRKRNYSGVVCLTAEYTAEEEVNRFVADDLAYIKSLFA